MRKLLLIPLLLASFAIAAPAAQATFPGKPGPLVYLKGTSSESGGEGGLAAHGPKVSQKAVFLTDESEDIDPAFSADGRLIAFSRPLFGVGSSAARVSGRAIFVMQRDGSGVRQLSDGTAFDAAPAFSPDGETIVFTREGGGRTHIWAMDADGGGEHKLTSGPNSEWDPVFTPNGKRIVYVSDADQDARSDHSDIWAMAPGGANQKVLIDGVRNEDEPDVSPNGRRVVFSSNRSHGPNLFVAGIDGKRLRPLTRSKGDCFRGRCYLSPVFSPDGRHIAALGGGRYSTSLTVMTADGSTSKTFDSGGTEEEGFGTYVVGPLAWGTAPR